MMKTTATIIPFPRRPSVKWVVPEQRVIVRVEGAMVDGTRVSWEYEMVLEGPHDEQ